MLQGGSVLANETKLDAQMDLQLVLLTIYGPPPSLNIPRLAATDLVNAVRSNRVNMVRCLLEAGADTCCWDHMAGQR